MHTLWFSTHSVPTTASNCLDNNTYNIVLLVLSASSLAKQQCIRCLLMYHSSTLRSWVRLVPHHYTTTDSLVFANEQITQAIELCTPSILITYTVVSWKTAHGRSTLQWAFFWLFPHLTTKERPHHVYSDLKPSKQIIGHKIAYTT